MEKVGNFLREKILILDDMRFQRALAADILTRGGYATVEVDSGLRALEIVTLESPDLILLDATTPDLSALQVIRRLKDDPFTNHIPILALTLEQNGDEPVNLLRQMADAGLTKPFTPEALLNQIETLLRRSFHYDSLTKLPAAPYLHRQIDARLAQNQMTAVLYTDIDHFRSFDQTYGHTAGDELLIETAKLLVDSLPARGAFVGHLGSDDFMTVLPPEAAETYAQTIVDQFRLLLRQAYNAVDLDRGYLLIEPRRGHSVQYPLMSLSTALVSNDRRALINYVQVSDILAELMRFIKGQGGGQWLRDRRSR